MVDTKFTVPNSFIDGCNEIRSLMWLYHNFIHAHTKEGEVIKLPYSSHIIVRAVEVLFFSRFSCVSGFYTVATAGVVIKGATKLPNLSYRAQPHSWLVFNENKNLVIDVIPVYGLLGITQPVVVNTFEGNHFGYLASKTVDPDYFTKEEHKKMCEDVETLSRIFESFLTKAPK